MSTPYGKRGFFYETWAEGGANGSGCVCRRTNARGSARVPHGGAKDAGGAVVPAGIPVRVRGFGERDLRPGSWWSGRSRRTLSRWSSIKEARDEEHLFRGRGPGAGGSDGDGRGGVGGAGGGTELAAPGADAVRDAISRGGVPGGMHDAVAAVGRGLAARGGGRTGVGTGGGGYLRQEDLRSKLWPVQSRAAERKRCGNRIFPGTEAECVLSVYRYCWSSAGSQIAEGMSDGATLVKEMRGKMREVIGKRQRAVWGRAERGARRPGASGGVACRGVGGERHTEWRPRALTVISSRASGRSRCWDAAQGLRPIFERSQFERGRLKGKKQLAPMPTNSDL